MTNTVKKHYRVIFNSIFSIQQKIIWFSLTIFHDKLQNIYNNLPLINADNNNNNNCNKNTVSRQDTITVLQHTCV